MRVIPQFDRVLVRPIDDGHITAGGLAMPDIAKKNRGLEFGEVLAVGNGRHNAEGTLVPVRVAIGATVLYPSQRNIAIPVPMPPGLMKAGDDDEILLIREADILAIIEDMPRPSSLMGLDGQPLVMTPAERRVLAIDPVAARAPQTPDSHLESVEIDAKLKEEGWDDGLGMGDEIAEDVRQ